MIIIGLFIGFALVCFGLVAALIRSFGQGVETND